MTHKELWIQIAKKAESLGKHETALFVGDGKLYLLAGTPLAYENDVCEKVEECLDKLKEIFGVEFENDCDVVSELRDIIVYKFESLAKAKIVHGFESY